MKILVLNAGSSSLKYAVFEGEALTLVAKGLVEKIGDEGGRINHKYLRESNWQDVSIDRSFPDHRDGLEALVELLSHDEHGCLQSKEEISTVGHRVVHGGEYVNQPTLIDKKLKEQIKELIPLAPLHNPANLLGIEVSEEVFPKAKQVAVFDTAFHQTLPERAYRYAIPNKLYEDYDIRVYGMHGTSHQYVANEAAKFIGKVPGDINLITVHLGNGCSMSAIEKGACIDTSLGLSPLPGLVMGTRSGDIDPAVIFQLMREHQYSYQEVENLLNKESGLKGLTGSTDMRDIYDKFSEGNEAAKLGLEVYTYRIKKYIGAYLAALGTVDAIVFTAGVGENAAYIRSMSLEGLSGLGIEIDEEENSKRVSGIHPIHKASSRTKLLVVPTDEERQIAMSAIAL